MLVQASLYISQHFTRILMYWASLRYPYNPLSPNDHMSHLGKARENKGPFPPLTTGRSRGPASLPIHAAVPRHPQELVRALHGPRIPTLGKLKGTGWLMGCAMERCPFKKERNQKFCALGRRNVMIWGNRTGTL